MAKRYFEVEFELNDRKLIPTYRFEAKDEMEAISKGLDELEDRDRSLVIPHSTMQNWVWQIMDRHGFTERIHEEGIWDDLIENEGYCEPLGYSDGRWIRGTVYVTELQPEQVEFEQWMDANGFHPDRNVVWVDGYSEPLVYCSNCQRVYPGLPQNGELWCRSCYATADPITPNGLMDYYRKRMKEGIL